MLCLILPVIFRKIDFNDKEGCIVYRFTRFHVYESGAGTLEREYSSMSVLVYPEVIYAVLLVVEHIFQAYVKRSVRRPYIAPYMDFIPDIPSDVSGWVGIQMGSSLV